MKVLIAGITGQLGSYTAELCLEKGYQVFGISKINAKQWRIRHLLDKIHLINLDIQDSFGIIKLFKDLQPDWVFNYSGQSHVGYSFENPHATLYGNIFGTLNLLEAIKLFSSKSRFYQNGSGEQFGEKSVPQDETCSFEPKSPYAIAKTTSHQLVENYRNNYDLFACSGIVFNSESHRRSEYFVTKKITKYVASLHQYKSSISGAFDNKFEKLKLGNINVFRDWGYAQDVSRANCLMLEQTHPSDFVIATGKTHSLKELLDVAFKTYNYNWENYIEIDKTLFRPNDINYLCGNPTKLINLGWQPTISFEKLIHSMVRDDRKLLT